MNMTFICIYLDHLCRYSGILRHRRSIISVTYTIESVIAPINAYNYLSNWNEQNGNIKSKAAMKLKDSFV